MNLQAATVPLTIANWGSAGLVKRYVPGLIAGELSGCNAMTEPDGGSDFLGAMRTRATPGRGRLGPQRREDVDHQRQRRRRGVVYAKTDPGAKHKGVTAFVVPTDTPGFSMHARALPGAGQLMPTNVVAFEDVRSPASNLLGEGEGLRGRDERDGLRAALGRVAVSRPGSGLPGRLGGVRDSARGVRSEDRLVPDDQEAARRDGLRGRRGPRARSNGRPRATTRALSRPGTARSRSTSPARSATARRRRQRRSSEAARSATIYPSASMSTTPSCGRPARGRPTSRLADRRRRAGLEADGPAPYVHSRPDPIADGNGAVRSVVASVAGRGTRGRRDHRAPRFGAVDPTQPAGAAQRLRRRDGRRHRRGIGWRRRDALGRGHRSWIAASARAGRSRR